MQREAFITKLLPDVKVLGDELIPLGKTFTLARATVDPESAVLWVDRRRVGEGEIVSRLGRKLCAGYAPGIQAWST